MHTVHTGELKMTKFLSPMLATATETLPPGTWIAEEKFDGHRCIVYVGQDRSVHGWSRNGKICLSGKDLPAHLLRAFDSFPVGIYDGELIVPHGYSSSVSDLSNRGKLQYVMFDVLELDRTPCVGHTWTERRQILNELHIRGFFDEHIMLASVVRVESWPDVQRLVDQIWARGGEGVILKDVKAPYRVGKRTKTFLKVKECHSTAVDGHPLEIIGFAPSEGEVNNYGDFGTAVLRDDDGIVVPVKVLDDEVRARLNKADTAHRVWQDVRLPGGKKVTMFTSHPWVGKLLHIEFQARTEESYRHPRWDRLVGE